MTILFHTSKSCPHCGNGNQLDQQLTAANARKQIGVLEKKKVALQMDVSPQYLGDLLSKPPRRNWNAELANKFVTAVKAVRGVEFE